MKISLNLKVKQRVLISVAFLTLIYVILTQFNLLSIFNVSNAKFDYIQPLILAPVAYILMFWISRFRIKGERFIVILGFPSVGVFVFTLFVELISTTIFGKLGQLSFVLITGALFSFYTYILFLTANILNVAYQDDVPLGQAGRAAYYVLNLIISYLLFFIVASNDFLFIFKLIAIFIIPFYITGSSLWTIRLKSGHRLANALSISLLITFAFFVLSIWPIGSTLLAFILSVILYVTLGISLEVRENISRTIWIEYALLFIFIFIILLTVSSWGINGTLI